jgi:kynurenine formamidase
MSNPPTDQLIDLTLPLREGMRGVAWESTRTVERDGWNARTLHLYSHAGTHMDAQVHFAAGEETIDQVPLERCLGTAWVIDAVGIAPGSSLEISHLGEVEGKFVAGESLLIRTGWWRHLDQPAMYRDGLPRVSESLANWCAESRVKMLAVEPPSVANVNDLEEVTRVHKILLGGGVTIVEGLCNTESIRSPKVFLVALPLKIAGGDGCPCRVLALEGDPTQLLSAL